MKTPEIHLRASLKLIHWGTAYKICYQRTRIYG